uniref:H/ACA ribonucleoprotein complex subunit n=1 Tax=Rhabditophanes sp. KR3021 TaxID=114890 RepID=A0AC35TIL9_9BILA
MDPNIPTLDTQEKPTVDGGQDKITNVEAMESEVPTIPTAPLLETTFKDPNVYLNHDLLFVDINKEPPGCGNDTDSDDEEINTILNHRKCLDPNRPPRSRSSSVSSVGSNYSVSSAVDEYLPEQWLRRDFILPESESLTLLGQVFNIVDTIVTVGNSEPSTRVYNLETNVFNSKRLCIGVIYDVMGSIDAPIYCLRFDTESNAGVVVPGESLFVASESKEFCETLLKENFKSMTIANEIYDPTCFSDDEEEQNYLNNIKQNKKDLKS